MKFRNLIISIISGCAILGSAASCVKVDTSLGSSFIPDSDKFITRTVSIRIDSMLVSYLDSLSGYSDSRMTIGSLRDERFGLTTRSTAFSLVPLADTLNWGSNVRFRQMHLGTVRDTLSYNGDDQANILQSVRVYALEKAIDSTYLYCNQIRRADYKGKPCITVGTPVYNGGDSLSFDLREEFASQYWKGWEGKKQPIDSVALYTKEHPGLFITLDEPMGNGGRLNFFKVESTVDNNNYLSGAFVELKIRADYGTRKDVDTSFFFALGAATTSVKGSCYAFNVSEHDSKDMQFGEPVEIACGKDYVKTVYLPHSDIPVEGGAGIKPLIEAGHLRNLAIAAIRDTLEHYGLLKDNIDSVLAHKKVIVNKASIVLPYSFPADYRQMEHYPQVLNPSLRITSSKTVSYAGLTDASVSSENQGEIDRSNNCYRPDISHHMQEILSTVVDSTLIKENIWFLILASETIEKESTSSTSDYYSQMAYLNYYNSMLGGYGGYGGYGYGGYGGYGYNNYSSYYMMQAMYNNMYNSENSTSTTTLLDKDRYYNASLNCPAKDKNIGDVPHLDITYSFLLPE